MFTSPLLRVLGVTSLTGVLLATAVSPASAADTTDYIYSGDGDTLRVVFYEHANFTGDRLIYKGGSSCSSSTTDTDYRMSVLPSGWNDKVSAIRDYSSCDVNIYTDGGFGGSSTGYVNYGSAGRYVGADFNDKMSSFKVS